MFKKIGIILLLILAAQCAGRQDSAFAQQPTECPPECVTDSLEIVTWYPSPYSEYEELRLYPTTRDSNYCDDEKTGLLYYDDNNTPMNSSDDKVKVCMGSSTWTGGGWQTLGHWGYLSGTTDIAPSNSGAVKIQNLKIDQTTQDGYVLTSDANGNASWKVVSGQGIQAANYSTSSRPACASGKMGTIIYDTDKNMLFLCTNNGWSSVDTGLAARSLTYTGSNHSRYDCMDAGGSVYETGSGTICKFNGTNVGCPAGWVQADSWQRYASNTWGGDSCGRYLSGGPIVFSNAQSSNKYSTGSVSGCLGYTMGFCTGNGGCWWTKAYDSSSNPITYQEGVGTSYNNSSNRVEVGCK